MAVLPSEDELRNVERGLIERWENVSDRELADYATHELRRLVSAIRAARVTDAGENRIAA